MSLHLTRPSLLLALLVSSAPAWAIDPFSVISVGGTAVDTVQAIAGGSREAAATAESLSALSELTGELGDNPALDESAVEINQRLQDLQNIALEAGYTHDEIDELLHGSRGDSEDFASMVHRITKGVRLAKRLAALGGISTQKAAQVSEIEQVQSRNDEKKILSNIYRQILVKDLDSKRERLKTERAIHQEMGKFRLFLGRLAPGGDFRLFPAQKAIVDKAITVFRSCSGYLLALVALIFVGRLLYYEFSFAPSEKYTELIFNTFVCFFLMIVFPTLFSYMAEFSDQLAAHLARSLHVAGAIVPESPGKVMGKVWPWWLQPAALQALAYFMVYSIFNLVLAVLIAIGPIAILAGTMLHFTFSLPAYFGLLVLVWLWPVAWNIVGYFGSLLWQGAGFSQSGIAEFLAAILFWLFQVLSPLVLFKHLQRSQVGQAVNGAYRHTAETRTVRKGSAKAEMAKQYVIAQATGGLGVAAYKLGAVFKGRPPRKRDDGLRIGREKYSI